MMLTKRLVQMIFQQPNVSSIYRRKSSRASSADRRESVSSNIAQLESELKSLRAKLSVGDRHESDEHDNDNNEEDDLRSLCQPHG